MISIAGVLVAGSAAALVNAQVLTGNSSPSAFSVDQTSPTTSAPTSAAAGTQDPVVTTTLVTTTASTQAVYAIGDAGSVTLDTSGDVLTIVDVSPSAGWTVTKSEADDASTVEIRLQAGSAEVEFHANLLFGVVTTSVESTDASVTSISVDDNSGHHTGSDDGSDD
jgi:hypothetical protein